MAAGVLVLVVAAFLPVVDHGFINWDDPEYFTDNPHLGGPLRDTLAWAFTTTHVGHYQPMNWLSYALDYRLGGLDPARYHLTQALLHALGAILVMYLAAGLMEIVSPSWHFHTRWAAAAVAALLFALHPLRVESVVWASARGDVLATVFYLAAVITYLSAARKAAQGAIAAPKRLLVLLFFVLAALSKEMAVTLPAVLILLDIYPLRRLSPRPSQWLNPPDRKVIMEKVPLFLFAAAITVIAFFAAGEVTVAGLREHPVSTRLAQLVVSLVHYPYRSFVPHSLSPLNEFPIGFGLTHPTVIASGLVLVLFVFAITLLRRRLPSVAAAACCFAILILPVTGLTQRGPQITADRYSYLACIPLAIAVGGFFAFCFARARWASFSVAVALLAILTFRMQSQLSLWSDSITLWNHALSVDATSGGAHCNLAHALETAGRSEEAVENYYRGIALGWRHPTVYRNLAAILQRLDRHEEAVAAYQADIASYPGRWETHYFLGVSFERLGDAASAAEQYRLALDLRLDVPDAHVALGRLFMEHGHDAEAAARLGYALDLAPRHAEALERLAIICARQGRYEEAIELVDRCIDEVSRRGAVEVIDGLTARRGEYLLARDEAARSAE